MSSCKICKQRGRRRTMREHLRSKYFEAFNFYFAKPINELVAQVPGISHVIYYKDYLILDESQEYLKRMYLKSEVTSRLQILNDFYASNYKPPHPNPILTDLHKLMLKRSNKLDKLFYQKQNLNQDSAAQQGVLSPDPVLNSKLNSKSSISYETLQHNIYEEAEIPTPILRLDLKGLNIIANLHTLNASEHDLDPNCDIVFEQCAAAVNLLSYHPGRHPHNFYKENPKSYLRRNPPSNNNHDVRERKSLALLKNQKSDSKNQSSFKLSKLKDSIEQAPEDPSEPNSKPKLSRVHSDTSTIQKMLCDYENRRNRQLRQTISSDLLPASTTSVIQGFQGSQMSIRQDHNNGSIHSSTSQKHEQLKKAYSQHPQQLAKKVGGAGNNLVSSLNVNQIGNYTSGSQSKNAQNFQSSNAEKEKGGRGGCLTERNHKRPVPISDEIMNKLQDMQQNQLKSVNHNEGKQKQEFKYLIPSQYNALQAMKYVQNKAKSSNSKKIMNDLGTKSQHFSTSNLSQQKPTPSLQKTDEIVKKYIQFAQQSVQNNNTSNSNNSKKKFDFKLNLQGLQLEHFQEQPNEDTNSQRNNFLTERPVAIERDFNSHRKLVLK